MPENTSTTLTFTVKLEVNPNLDQLFLQELAADFISEIEERVESFVTGYDDIITYLVDDNYCVE